MNTNLRWTFILATFSGTAGACGGGEAVSAVSGVDFEAPAGSRTPTLTRAGDGAPVLSWFQVGEDTVLLTAVRRRGVWSEPVPVATRSSFFVNWADFPGVTVASDGRWLVHWLERTATSPYAYHIMISTSPDEGRTWSDPVVPHDDRSDTEHGFVATAAGDSGAIHLAWLDGRFTGGTPAGMMTTRFATVMPDGRITGERELDGSTCDCCPVSMTATSGGGLLVAYRNRTAEEVRDIYVTRRTPEGWSEPVAVANDGWVHRACPVNGPALAAHGERVTVAWYTAAGDSARMYMAVSEDGGATWTHRTRLDDGDPLGRGTATPRSDGASLSVWLEGRGEEAAWVARRVAPVGGPGPVLTLAESSRARAVGFPRILAAGEEVFVTWTARGGDREHVEVRRLLTGSPEDTKVRRR